MNGRFSTAGLARISARRPWIVLSAWLALLIFAGVASTGLGDAFSTDANFTGKPESIRADDLLAQRLRAGQGEPLPETFAPVTTYYDAVAAGDPAAAGLISADRGTTLIPVTFAHGFDTEAYT